MLTYANTPVLLMFEKDRGSYRVEMVLQTNSISKLSFIMFITLRRNGKSNFMKFSCQVKLYL